jgi:DEAD/DEAH box helicase domain-containing protein
MSYIVLDIETQKGKDDVGGWLPELMGLAIAVTYDPQNGSRVWRESETLLLLAELSSFEKIVGYNLLSFDYGVLKPYDSMNFLNQIRPKTIDLLDRFNRAAGFRIKLDDLADINLGIRKSSNGLQSLIWWKEGKVDEVIEYCKMDVEVTNKLYEFVLQNNFVEYSSYGRIKRVSLNIAL